MGGIISSIFGTGGASTPDIPAQPLRENETEAESKSVRDSELRKIRARRGLAGTVLTSPLGSSTNSSTGVLGRTIGQ